MKYSKLTFHCMTKLLRILINSFCVLIYKTSSNIMRFSIYQEKTYPVFEMIPKTWKRRGRSIQYGSHGAYTNSLSHVRGIQTHLVFALPTSLTITNVQYLQYTMTNAILCGSVIFLPSTFSLNTLKVLIIICLEYRKLMYVY